MSAPSCGRSLREGGRAREGASKVERCDIRTPQSTPHSKAPCRLPSCTQHSRGRVSPRRPTCSRVRCAGGRVTLEVPRPGKSIPHTPSRSPALAALAAVGDDRVAALVFVAATVRPAGPRATADAIETEEWLCWEEREVAARAAALAAAAGVAATGDEVRAWRWWQWRTDVCTRPSTRRAIARRSNRRSRCNTRQIWHYAPRTRVLCAHAFRPAPCRRRLRPHC